MLSPEDALAAGPQDSLQKVLYCLALCDEATGLPLRPATEGEAQQLKLMLASRELGLGGEEEGEADGGEANETSEEADDDDGAAVASFERVKHEQLGCRAGGAAGSRQQLLPHGLRCLHKAAAASRRGGRGGTDRGAVAQVRACVLTHSLALT